MKQDLPKQVDALKEANKALKDEILKELDKISKNFDLTTICNPKTQAETVVNEEDEEASKEKSKEPSEESNKGSKRSLGLANQYNIGSFVEL